MKRFSVVLIVFSLALAARAQIDTNALAATVTANAVSAMADTNAPTRAMSLQDCIHEALQHNFDVQYQRYNPMLQLYDLRAAYNGYDPTFKISGQHDYNASPGGGFNQFSTNPIPARITKADSFNSSLGGTMPWGLQYTLSGNIDDTTSSANPESTSGQIGASLTQPLLKNFWIDETRLTIRVDRNRFKYSQQGLRNQIITTATAVENAYYELSYAQENVKVQQEALQLAQTQLDQDNQRVQIGTVAERAGTIEQDEAQVAQNKASLIQAFSTLGTDQRVLKNLLTDEYIKWHEQDIQPTEPLIAAPQSFNLQESWRKGMTERPDLLQAQLDVEKQGITLKFDRNQIFPELDLIGSYGFNGGSTKVNGGGGEFSDVFNQYYQGNSPFYSYGAQLSIPLSNVGARNTYKADKVTEKQLLLTLKQKEQQIMVDIDNAVGVAQSDYESVQASRQARIYAEAALDAEQKKYAVGKSTTFTVLQLQNTLTADRGQEIRALANYNQALANLAQQEGSALERDRIDVQAK